MSRYIDADRCTDILYLDESSKGETLIVENAFTEDIKEIMRMCKYIVHELNLNNKIDRIMNRTKYKTIPIIGIRLIYRDGEYVGWYRPKLRKVLK